VVAAPFAAHLFLHMGFYNYCGGLVLFFVIVGYWLRRREGFTPLQTLLLAALVLAAYFFHLTAVAAAALVIAVVSLAAPGRAPARGGAGGAGGAPGPAFLPRPFRPFSAFQPGGGWGVFFAARQGVKPPVQAAEPLWRQALELVQLQALVCYDVLEGLV